jgi:hypothetical protein
MTFLQAMQANKVWELIISLGLHFIIVIPGGAGNESSSHQPAYPSSAVVTVAQPTMSQEYYWSTLASDHLSKPPMQTSYQYIFDG